MLVHDHRASSAGSDDRPASALDDEDDREELRTRYYGLMQELRVLLPGVQVLVAFLLTAPFASRFDQLDDLGHGLYVVALGAGVLAVICFLAPTAFHRFGPRRARRHRLRAGILALRAGVVLLGLSLLTALTVILRFVAGTPVAVAVVGCTVAVLLVLWVGVPQWMRRTG